MDIKNLRKTALNLVPELISEIFGCQNFDFSSNLELVKFRVKSEKSIKEKCNKLNFNLEQVYDLVGVRFVLSEVSMCYLLKEAIMRNTNFAVREIRDYIANPKDADKYRALHIHIKYKDVLCEIQLMDLEMHKLDEKTHDDYKKGLFAIK